MALAAAVLTVTDVAEHFSRLYPPTVVRAWQVRRLVERGLLPEPGRVGCYRVFSVDDLPGIEAALRKVGYLQAKEV